MASLRKKRRIQLVIIGACLLIVASGLVIYGLGQGAEFFRSPTQVMAETPSAAERFRLGGLVAEGSVVRGQGAAISFAVTDGGNSIPVRFEGILPDLFREGQGAVMSGMLVNGVFEASEVLAKHDETYMPKEVIDALKEQGVYQGDN